MRQDIAMPAVSAFVSADSASARTSAGFGSDTLLLHDYSATASIAVESASGMRLADIEGDWRNLIGRCLEPNVFMDPAVIDSAQRHLASRRYITLLAWRHGRERPKLIGLWGLSIGRPDHSALPVRVLRAPPVPHGYLATPVVDRNDAEPALAAMLDFLARDRSLPALIALDAAASDGPTMQALAHVVEARGSASLILAQARRPMLISDLDAKQYFEKALSGSSRKKLRQHRRRLAERGTLESKAWSAPDAVHRAFEDFLALEAAGWKGRCGSALLCDPGEAAFARTMVAALARHGNAAIYGLTLNGRPVSMQVVLRAGAVAFTWKTAYDESMHDFSPGMLLLEDYTKAFLADDRIVSVDSCAYDEGSFMAAWSERCTVAQIWIDVRQGRFLRFIALAGVQKAFLAMRTAVKQMHLRWRRGWKAN